MSKAGTQVATHDWLAPLLAAYHRVRDAGEAHAPAALHDELLLAHTAGRRLTLAGNADPGLQVVVLGPTQAGKSTLVNVLLGSDIAGVNALAGHTVHAQAFARSDNVEHVAAVLEPLMAPLTRVPRDALERDRRDTWSCDAVAGDARLLDATVWDTPDFDSIEAASYRDAVTLASGIADVVVLVLSKDKYGDLSVWERIGVLRALGTPLLLVVNKLDEASRDIVANALRARWKEYASSDELHDTPIATVLLPWLAGIDASGWPDVQRAALAEALERAGTAALDLPARRAALNRFVEARREQWLAPLHEEYAARARWQAAVATAAVTIEDGYRTRYLEQADRYDAFDRTLVELLALLEVPGIARVLARTRQAVTWPARKLLGLGLGAAGDVAARWRTQSPAQRAVSREREVLDTLLDNALTGLRERAFEEREDAAGTFWRTVESTLVRQRASIEHDWGSRADALRDAFQPRIDAAAHALYQRLQAQPVLLNTLRATRVTTDAAGVALALKSGGIAPADLVLAPAMLSVTTLLTESALGRYLDGIKRELKNEQADMLSRDLIRPVFVERLTHIADQSGAAMLLPGPIDPALRRALAATPARDSGKNNA